MSCNRFLKATSFLLAAIMLQGCDSSSQPSQKTVELQVTERTIELYNSSCSTCHETEVTGAPQTGDVLAWQQRMDKGMDALLESAINGSGGMPPLGLCMECNEADFKALIHYMAAGQS